MPLRRHFILSAAVLILGACPLLAANVTYTVNGTLGPVLSGSDPLKASGKSAAVTVTASETLTPIKHTAVYAVYKLPVGAITVNLNGKTYTSTQVSYLVYVLPAGAQKLILATTVTEFGIPISLTATVQLAKGSFPASALTHPAKFTPSPQTLTAATVAGGPGSQFKYSASVLGTTVLGLKGSASN